MPAYDTNQCWHMCKALECSCIDYQSASETVRRHLKAMARYGAVLLLKTLYSDRITPSNGEHYELELRAEKGPLQYAQLNIASYIQYI